ncbi:MAG: type IV pilin protein [Pseudomonadota bacterium]
MLIRPRPRKNCSAFTLIELLLVTLIITVFLLAALPLYRQQLLGAHRQLAKLELLSASARQQQYFAERTYYASSLTELGYAGSPYAIDGTGEQVTPGSDQGIYLIELEASDPGGGYTLHARPYGLQARDRTCGTLSVTDRGERLVTGRDAGKCW